MTFSVEPAALRRCAGALGTGGEASRSARSYASEHGTISWHDEGLITFMTGAHDNFVKALGRQLQHLGDLLDASATELNRAADFYDRTDRDAAARADSTYPPVARPAYRTRGD
jgi:hypothetical protein